MDSIVPRFKPDNRARTSARWRASAIRSGRRRSRASLTAILARAQIGRELELRHSLGEVLANFVQFSRDILHPAGRDREPEIVIIFQRRPLVVTVTGIDALADQIT